MDEAEECTAETSTPGWRSVIWSIADCLALQAGQLCLKPQILYLQRLSFGIQPVPVQQAQKKRDSAKYHNVHPAPQKFRSERNEEFTVSAPTHRED